MPLFLTRERRGFSALWEGFVLKFEARDFVKFSPVTILNIFGEHDIRVPARRVRSYEELGTGIQNIEIHEAAHFPFIVQRDRKRVISEIERFALKK